VKKFSTRNREMGHYAHPEVKVFTVESARNKEWSILFFDLERKPY